MKVAYSRRARNDLFTAIRYYESQREGLGREFLEIITALTKSIGRMPDLYPMRYPPYRTACVLRFPYTINYLVNGSEVLVHSIYHTRKNPLDWEGLIA